MTLAFKIICSEKLWQDQPKRKRWLMRMLGLFQPGVQFVAEFCAVTALLVDLWSSCRLLSDLAFETPFSMVFGSVGKGILSVWCYRFASAHSLFPKASTSPTRALQTFRSTNGFLALLCSVIIHTITVVVNHAVCNYWSTWFRSVLWSLNISLKTSKNRPMCTEMQTILTRPSWKSAFERLWESSHAV